MTNAASQSLVLSPHLCHINEQENWQSFKVCNLMCQECKDQLAMNRKEENTVQTEWGEKWIHIRLRRDKCKMYKSKNKEDKK